MPRVLGFAIGVLLIGAVVAALVRGPEREPLAGPTPTVAPTSPSPSPTVTMTFDGLPPFSPTPTAGTPGPTPAVSPTGTLPKTGEGSSSGATVVTLVVAVAAGWGFWRTLRRPAG